LWEKLSLHFISRFYTRIFQSMYIQNRYIKLDTLYATMCQRD